eukprot:1159332-Pelagomonas_calceolata.AAC.5
MTSRRKATLAVLGSLGIAVGLAGLMGKRYSATGGAVPGSLACVSGLMVAYYCFNLIAIPSVAPKPGHGKGGERPAAKRGGRCSLVQVMRNFDKNKAQCKGRYKSAPCMACCKWKGFCLLNWKAAVPKGLYTLVKSSYTSAKSSGVAAFICIAQADVKGWRRPATGPCAAANTAAVAAAAARNGQAKVGWGSVPFRMPIGMKRFLR